MPVTLAREFLLGSEQFKARLRCFSRGDDQLRSSIVWLGPSDLRTCPPDTASILATTFFQPSLKFRNAVAFFGNIRQYEAGMHDTQPCAAIDFGESPGDDRVVPGGFEVTAWTTRLMLDLVDDAGRHGGFAAAPQPGASSTLLSESGH